MEPENSVPGSIRLLRLSEKCLRRRDFDGCRKYALEARNFDPNNANVDQILAIADVLLAGEYRLRNHHHDWYAILQLRRHDSGNRKLVFAQFQKLVALVKPSQNGFAFSEEAFKLVCDAWGVLSNPVKRTQYENYISNEQEPARQKELEQESKDIDQDDKGSGGNETFWTVCACCYCMYEYEKVYEECCLRCQNCRKPFHGVAIKAPSPEIIVPGKEQYYFCYGVFPMKSNTGPVEEDMKANDKKDGEASNGFVGGSGPNVVVISDDDEDDDSSLGESIRLDSCGGPSNKRENGNRDVMGLCEESVKNEGEIQNTGIAELRDDVKRPKRISKAPAKRMKNMKSVAINTKKVMANGLGSKEAMGWETWIQMR
ncbi:hypothetical protein FNV43_RR17489 [Rhamnella rubrinervis]|uniref:J domain-containing protein n=1 Tax=Rhamnella rubrinervis TaxID=2594499 RepID=A0A8K0E3T2_9ROSA|nr:hypothetical protein FNV43_RR17489 [Rhamnella rubrinervis]